MSNQSKVSELRSKARLLLGEAAAIERAESDAANAAMIGRTFKYLDCYSLPETEADYWLVYQRVIGTRDGDLVAVVFQTDKEGKLQAGIEDCYHRTLGEEITLAEYEAALTEFQAAVARTLSTQPERRDD